MQFFASAKMTEEFRDRNELKDPQRSSKVTGGQKEVTRGQEPWKLTMTDTNAIFCL